MKGTHYGLKTAKREGEWVESSQLMGEGMMKNVDDLIKT